MCKFFVFLKDGGMFWDIPDIESEDEMPEVIEPESRKPYGENWEEEFICFSVDQLLRDRGYLLYMAKEHQKELINGIIEYFK